MVLAALLLIPMPALAGGGATLRDNFRSYGSQTYTDGDTFGPWQVNFAGYGKVETDSKRGGALTLEPKVATQADQTHAGLVTSRESFAGRCLRAKYVLRTSEQLRTGSRANPWEMAWAVWDYTDNHHFMYFIAKPNGVELGQRHPDYPGGQRFLATSSSPTVQPGDKVRIKVKRVVGNDGSTMTRVWLNKELVAKFLDRLHPYTAGAVGVYTEDARVQAHKMVAKTCR